MPFLPDGASSGPDSSLPRPVMNLSKWPTDTDEGNGIERLHKAFRKVLNEHEDRVTRAADGTTPSHEWQGIIYPALLTNLCTDCRALDDGILETKEALKDIRFLVLTDSVYSVLVTLRMMQLNLAGNEDYEETWLTSLKYSNKRLAKLIFQSNHGADRWLKYEIENDEDFCRACLSMGNGPKMKATMDMVTELPCSHGHTIHTGCIDEWTKRNRHCPECLEYIL